MSSVRRLAAALGSILAGAGLGLGCSPTGVFQCESSEQCQAGAQQGVCTAAGYCAFEDESCDSDLAYGELAAPELAGKCVPIDGGTGDPETTTGAETDTGGGTTSGTTTTSSSGLPPSTSDETGPVSQCGAGPGTPCVPDDPCAVGGMCDANGTCVPSGTIGCDAPPGPCSMPRGQCQPDGSCDYPPMPPMTACEDGDPCTEGDVCDGAGTCVPGPACANAGACEVGSCTEMGCAYEALADGTSCGPLASARCCGGQCVDISSDLANCGGCGAACAAGEECESVAYTATCADAPADTSGRCTCMSDGACPLGQTCRAQVPFLGRCSPADDLACPGMAVDVPQCPSYCTY